MLLRTLCLHSIFTCSILINSHVFNNMNTVVNWIRMELRRPKWNPGTAEFLPSSARYRKLRFKHQAHTLNLTGIWTKIENQVYAWNTSLAEYGRPIRTIRSPWSWASAQSILWTCAECLRYTAVVEKLARLKSTLECGRYAAFATMLLGIWGQNTFLSPSGLKLLSNLPFCTQPERASDTQFIM